MDDVGRLHLGDAPVLARPDDHRRRQPRKPRADVHHVAAREVEVAFDGEPAVGGPVGVADGAVD